VLFDAIEYWRRPQVLCLTARETPGALSALVQSLREQLQARGFEPERREYRAHLTVARKVPRPPGELPLDPLCWPVGGVALVESITARAGARYEPRATWPLQG
jgi:2'-5' RNA ligase